MRTMPTPAERHAAAIIADRLRAIAPIEHHDNGDEPAGRAIADMQAIADGLNIGDEAAIEWAMAMAVEATAEYTTDGCEDEAAAEAFEAAIGG